MADVADYTQAVNITGGSVTILGTASVAITGTPTVAITGTPTVNVGNTPSVSITSGTVTATISGTPNINISSQSVQVNVALADGPLANIECATAASPQTLALPTGTKAVGLFSGWPPASLTHLKIADHESGVVYYESFRPSVQAPFGFFILAIPVSSLTGDASSASIDVTFAASSTFHLHVVAFTHEADLWQEFFAPPFSHPNQLPIHNELGLASGVAQWIVAPAANVSLTLFDILFMYFTNAAPGDQWYIAHAAALPGAGVFPANAAVLATGGTSGVWPFIYPLHGVKLPAGDGVYAEVRTSAAANMGVSLNNSVS